jgi:uncharacterized membrane protein YdjX (TVP38/TMEM64 family)
MALFSPWYLENNTQGAWRRVFWGSVHSVLAVLALLALVVVLSILIQKYLDIEALRASLESFGFLAPLMFIGVSALKNILFIPVVPLALLIGLGSLVFGKGYGAFYFWVGSTAGACLAFLMARYWLTEFAARLKRGRLKWLDAVVSGHGLLSILGLRLVLFSNLPLNFGSGVTSMTLRDYTLGTLIGLMPRTFVVSYVFESVQNPNVWSDLLTYPSSLLLPLLLLSKVVGILLLASLVRTYIKAGRVVQG